MWVIETMSGIHGSVCVCLVSNIFGHVGLPRGSLFSDLKSMGNRRHSYNIIIILEQTAPHNQPGNVLCPTSRRETTRNGGGCWIHKKKVKNEGEMVCLFHCLTSS